MWDSLTIKLFFLNQNKSTAYAKVFIIYTANDFKTISYVSCFKNNCVFLSHNEVFNPGLKAFFLAVIETLSPKETIIHLKNKPQ